MKKINIVPDRVKSIRPRSYGGNLTGDFSTW
jgi:hypothetical protein